MAGEILALRLISLHNVYFYQQLVASARRAIIAGSYAEWAEQAEEPELLLGEEPGCPSKDAAAEPD
jgi:tRNA-guanine family transglycosylase